MSNFDNEKKTAAATAPIGAAAPTGVKPQAPPPMPPLQAAADPKKERGSAFEGTLVSTKGNQIVVANKEGKEFTHTLAPDAALSCDGQICKSEDLQSGRKIRVTMNRDERKLVTGVEMLDKSAEFAHQAS